jgi:uncharacterized protein with von Willebrand factor type A (vWA) domain
MIQYYIVRATDSVIKSTINKINHILHSTLQSNFCFQHLHEELMQTQKSTSIRTTYFVTKPQILSSGCYYTTHYILKYCTNK